MPTFESVVSGADAEVVSADVYEIGQDPLVVEFWEIFKRVFSGVDPDSLHNGSVFYWTIDVGTGRSEMSEHYVTEGGKEQC